MLIYERQEPRINQTFILFRDQEFSGYFSGIMTMREVDESETGTMATVRILVAKAVRFLDLIQKG